MKLTKQEIVKELVKCGKEETERGTLSAQFAAGKTPVATDDFQNLAQEEDPED